MKKTIYLFGVLVSLWAFTACNKSEKPAAPETSAVSDKDKEIEAKVDALIAKMSPEEKAGQMTQVNLNKILYTGNGSGYDNNYGIIDPALLDTAIVKYKVGSILNAINRAYSQDQWISIITQIQDKATKTGQNIPVLYGIDAIHGVTFTLNSTLFPHNIGTAASWNPAVEAAGAEVTALEARACGLRWNFDPVLDLGRNPLWPRFPETFGEDPYLVEQMGVAAISKYEEAGLGSPKAVASCMKHFIGYSASRTGRDRTPSFIPEIELREYYLPQFQAAVKAGASTIMINSGEINGVPVHANKYLLTDVLRGELGFKGLIVTDWEDINRLHERHNISPTMRDAVKTAILAGIDMSMTPNDYEFTKHLISLIKDGEIPMAHIDASVKRILTLKMKLGLFENPVVEKEAIANFGKPEYAEKALFAARQTITLLKNDKNTLPLKKEIKIVVAGPNANNVPSLHGCWSYTWQGADASAKLSSKGDKNFINGVTFGDSILPLFPKSTLTIKQALEAKIGAGKVVCQSVENYEDPKNYSLPSLAGADAIVLCLGENSYAESPGSIRDLTLDARQIALAQAAIKTGKPVILVLVEGRPRVISAFVDGVPAVVDAFWPGSQGANAIADVLFGDYNPGGKLPFSYPKHTGDFIMYDHKWTEANVETTPGGFVDEGYMPQWPFGHGLSYTTFEYSDAKISTDTLIGDAKLKVSVTVKNTGTVDGEEVVQLYTRDMFASVVPNSKRLRAFERVAIKAGESKTVSFEISRADLSFVKEEQTATTHKFTRVTEEGAFKVMIGGSSNFELEAAPFPWMTFPYRTYKGALNFYYKEK
ncbi:glycoside hydrolase family 3 N-terminal domain-containing protein [Cytophaga hutchinsonii]|uniref:beta-glucosidase n=1 Tax=Cytophaga hutchinsonii (strain ATCC 33406 / DSM 1761 / CIP 103989 / NBRC 15051 / NCIMB 9469 / D465) TaxID=269798 RepID=A0A6N4SSX2_CYTH3|nr:glycoside hydrolase family 3 N-terminal domain-containing protein [Cytophaga hutchinsonii]ABG59535.1 candidate b-glucosidase, Glycoside Hydrolase Family 3 protein [Cytophaga hutchinsonii ATCC 33406]SFX95031.1 beta-glucosidase [Cytophaga hutchinsonii ATCC 33406]